MSDSEDDDEVVIVEDFDRKLADLCPMFPSLPRDDVRQTLLTTDGDVEKAINVLIDIGRNALSECQLYNIHRDLWGNIMIPHPFFGK